ncbi:glycolate oxidase iron-sulfur subunit [Scopulibacillus darangshiensis]|uniref:Glycolate oxidase iron-sulfur subunit n=1 Tax=Scopulibacillus darangshiensis TaxID=442528 RepID=A0A4R2P296_9BACL|nr:(Fe-S)-binding protein [Scopulibacillus darangshiensis]TCP28833.1 glycolate oxidase iron-sulfur subunit [Scopulibacillus darangshiensis]
MDKELKQLQEKINYDKTFDCVQCGYCLPACPTYETMKKETHSPRGRINLVKEYAEGKISVEDLKEPIDKCLGCNACTVVCPTNVQYGKILEGAKHVIEEKRTKSKKEEWVENLIFDKVFPSRKWMKRIGNVSWLYQKSGLQSLAQKIKMTSIAPLHLDQFEKVLPDLPSPTKRKSRPKVIKAEGETRMRVGFFTGCIMDSVFFEINKKTIELLIKAGCDVVIPETQTCCGALHAHSGKVESSRQLAKQNMIAFEEEHVDVIVNNAGGCGARLVEYEELFTDEQWKEKAKSFVEKTRDVSQILYEALDQIEFTRPINDIVTYQTSCHMINVQKVTKEPFELLQSIPGIEYRQFKGYDRCCGSAGIYNMLNYDDAMDILDKKMTHVKVSRAHTIVTTNPGCLLQMKLGIQREGLQGKMRAVHLVELLHEAEPVSKERQVTAISNNA